MKVQLAAEQPNKASFKGFQHKRTPFGLRIFEFNYPHDFTKFDVHLELFSVKPNGDKCFEPLMQLRDKTSGKDHVKIGPGGIKLELSEAFGLKDNEPFAYLYKVIDKLNPNRPARVVESGTIVKRDGQNYNLVTQGASKLNKGGPMYLAFPDAHNVGFVYDQKGNVGFDKTALDKAKGATRNFANKLGGTIAGIEAQVPKLREQGYTRVITTPIFTDDSVSSHSYWIKNAMQMTQSLGTINNYASLQRELFKNGMNFVADGAFVNEGLEGVHFKDVLRWGENSPYYKWFRADGIKNGPLGLGVFAKSKANIGHKVVNSPYSYIFDEKTCQILTKPNKNYNPKKPTYVQIFDKRLASDAQKTDSTSLIATYDKLSTENATEINTHNDTVVPYAFVIKPEIYNANVRNLNEYNKINSASPIKLDTFESTRFLTASDTSELTNKVEGGVETWDANTDIPKLNFTTSRTDDLNLQSTLDVAKAGELEEVANHNYEVQSYAVNAGKYWTKKTNDILIQYAAKTIGDVRTPQEAIEAIEKLIKDKQLPPMTGEDLSALVTNVFNKSYQLKGVSKPGNYREALLSGLMDLPLDSIELGDDIVATLGYSYITPRATCAAELGKSTYKLFKEQRLHTIPRVQNLYTEQLTEFANSIIKTLDEKLPAESKLRDDKNVAFRKYALPLMAQDIAKFAIVKSLHPKAGFTIKPETGEILYDYAQLKKLSLAEIGVEGNGPLEEAEALVTKMQSGIESISQEDREQLVNSLYHQYKDTNSNSFKLAEMIVDKTQSGLDWRIDAAKDIADIDAIRNGNASFSKTWDKVINFWKNFTNSVHDENPNSYMVAEITNTGDLHDIAGKGGRFADATAAELRFLQETGINTVANYSYFFTDLVKAFAKAFEPHWLGLSLDEAEKNRRVYDLLVGNRKYLQSAQLESLLFSYTFAGNHDKPRALHCLALDMELFFSSFWDKKHKQTAAAILKNKDIADVTDSDINSIHFDTITGKSIAMGKAMKEAFCKAVSENISDKQEGKMLNDQIGKAISELARGQYLKTSFSPDAFGVKPFDVTIDMIIKQMKHNGCKLTAEQEKLLTNKVFEIMLTPAMSRLEGLMSFLVSLPGNPTMFGGDEVGITGFEEKCKNIYLQNRSLVNLDVLTDKNKKFLQDFNDRIKAIMALRARPELQPLNTGTPYALALHSDELSNGTVQMPGVLRQDSDGSMVISMFNSKGVTYKNEVGIGKDPVKLDKISFHSDTENPSITGLKGGLTAGTEFKNADTVDQSLYIVCESEGNYFIKKFSNREEYEKIVAKQADFTDENKITFDTRNLILHTNKSKPSFKGKKVLYNPQYNFVSSPYKQTEQPKIGEKLAAIAR